MEAQEKGKPMCPKCGLPVSYFDSYKRGGNVYYLAVHYLGYYKDPSTGKVRKRTRKCYLGPKEYIYVSQLHQDLGLTFKGLAEDRRLIHYLRALREALEDVKFKKELLVELKKIAQDIIRVVDRKLEEKPQEESV